MKNALTILTFAAVLIASPAFANHQGHDHAGTPVNTAALHEGVKAAQCADTINVKVNGLVCDFCARALEKVFGARSEVTGINVDLDNGKVVIATMPGQTIDDDTVAQLITDSGYNVTAIDRGC
ncbi:MAG: hypothetical protein GC131_05755 [Alphaproteobacteria bacterium]|nr:hypothetical protein [Alphaproteobacteria bacterium]